MLISEIIDIERRNIATGFCMITLACSLLVFKIIWHRALKSETYRTSITQYPSTPQFVGDWPYGQKPTTKTNKPMTNPTL
jgi:hypothetical protein